MTPLQNYCLQVMGITQWQLKSHDEPSLKPYLLLLDEVLTDEKNQLLTRLLQAMQWQGKARIESVQAHENIQDKIANAQKIILFGQSLAQHLNEVQFSNAVVVPSVEQMLNDVQAKKQAWGILKGFM